MEQTLQHSSNGYVTEPYAEEQGGMEYPGDKHGVPGLDKDYREAVVMLRLAEERHTHLRKDFDKLEAQVNGERGMAYRLTATEIISAERYRNALRRQNCGYVVAAALIIGIVTWVTVQFGQMRDRDMLRQQLAHPSYQGPGVTGPATPGK